MKQEFNENPGEQKSSQVGSETSGNKISLINGGYSVSVASLAYNRYIAYHHYVDLPIGFLGNITQLTCELDYCLEKPVTIHIDIDLVFKECIWVDPILFEICKTYKGQAKKGKLSYHSLGDLEIVDLYITRDGVLEVWIDS